VNGTPVHGLVRSFDYTPQQRIGIVIYCLSLLWGLETLTAVFQFAMGFAVANWYFTPCRPDLSKPPISGDVWRRGFYYAVRYHIGSLALGAAIVGAFRLVHVALEFIARQAKGDGNRVAELIAHTCMCCVWCFEEIVRYLNKNATIEMVLRSTDFSTSAGAALRRLGDAAPEVAALNGITVIFQLLGMASITCLGTYVPWLMISHIDQYTNPASDWYIEDPVAVVAATGAVALLVAAAFMFVFDMTSDTLLFCWLCDTEDGVTEFAPKPLRNLIGSPPRAPAGDGAADF